MISCATSTEPLVTLQTRNLQNGGERTARAARNGNLDHFLKMDTVCHASAETFRDMESN
jgi:hypothetical protein